MLVLLVRVLAIFGLRLDLEMYFEGCLIILVSTLVLIL